jgi:hypothetical protein
MAISTREQEVPNKLPAALLYLDDIVQIQEIILEAAGSRAASQRLCALNNWFG